MPKRMFTLLVFSLVCKHMLNCSFKLSMITDEKIVKQLNLFNLIKTLQGNV